MHQQLLGIKATPKANHEDRMGFVDSVGQAIIAKDRGFPVEPQFNLW
jgi:hypothetical protein